MKKFLVLVFAIVFIFLSFPACSESLPQISITNLKLNDKVSCQDTSIKTSIVSYVITPAGFDFEELNKQGYIMQITVSYKVYYVKDWNVPWDIGYTGAPKYEVCILDDDFVGNLEANIVAPSKSNAKTKTITYTTNAVNLIGSKIYLTFSSDNIQNIIYFKNISVTYNCFK